ncbi:DUF3696 domain-containing protein [Sorangium sp. KYC3313]|uniref:AAA family ATPase n=1 Tax=Sorangium sp. KYC3313 TaxID=3449740 RepID=UPI003F8B3D70
MLTRWQISNFKSAYDTTELALRPITIFAGANSSGKSTFIQSILLVAQSLSSRVYSRPIVLNGHIARLGSFDDVASTNSEQDEISIGFTIRVPGDGRESGVRRLRYFYETEDLAEVGCEFAFSPGGDSPSRELARLQPRLIRGKLWSIRKGAEQDELIEYRYSSTLAQSRRSALDPSRASVDDVDSLEYEVVSPTTLPARSGRYLANELPTGATLVGARLFHFLPSDFAFAFDLTEHLATVAVRRLIQPSYGSGQSARAQNLDTSYITSSLMRRVFEIARGFIEPTKRSIESARRTILSRRRQLEIDEAYKEASRHLTMESLQRLQRSLGSPALAVAYGEKFQELVDLARDGRPSVRQFIHLPPAPEVTRVVQVVFTQLFKYLGPLRDEPKPVYPMEGAVDPSDVGLRGEFTAAVLDLHKHRRIVSIPSSCFALSQSQIVRKEMSLQDAVLDWLNYLGVVRKVETRDRGIFGHELRVATGNTDTLHNLVHVGVGVSQVLPILVMSLMAETGSILVFEQPELHLHPKVQTLLADFVLSMALLGKQCIIETHSEYIINRLRLRAAEDPADSIQALLALYFVEKEGAKSRYRMVNINEFGAIGDWPEGFFDQAPQEAERILRAAIEKRRTRRVKNV